MAAVPAVDTLHTRSSMKTRPICTSHGADLTVLPVEALWTRTQKVVHHILEEAKERPLINAVSGINSRQQGMLTYFAASTVLARVAVAFVGFDLTVLAGEPRSTGAGVAALASVGARGIVLTRLVVGAVVQI